MKITKLPITIILICFLPSLVSSQENNTSINLKGKLFLGFETGLNTISSFSHGEANQSIQAGFGVATFEWTKNISPFALILQNGKKEKNIQFRIQA